MDEIQQESRKKDKHSDGKEIDRLSNLPESLILHIFTFIDTKYAVQTCVLSKQWKDLWTHLLCLNLDNQSFKRVVSFKKFITHVLRNRKSFSLQSLKFSSRAQTDGLMLNRIIDYAKSHKVKELCLSNFRCWPPELSNCQSLVTLKICNPKGKFPSLFHFAPLTTLHIRHVLLSNENGGLHFISSCMNLESLVLFRCSVKDVDVLKISAPRLVNLILSKFGFRRSLASPPPECNPKVVISSSRLALFEFEGPDLFQPCLDNRVSPEKVNICLHVQPWTSLDIVDKFTEQLKDMLCMCLNFLNKAKSLTASLKGQFLGIPTSATINYHNLKGLSITGTSNPYNDLAEFVRHLVLTEPDVKMTCKGSSKAFSVCWNVARADTS